MAEKAIIALKAPTEGRNAVGAGVAGVVFHSAEVYHRHSEPQCSCRILVLEVSPEYVALLLYSFLISPIKSKTNSS